MVHRVHVTVRGRVQGVGYRNWAYSQAKLLKINGWVRNLPEGDVELSAEGPEGALRSFVTLLKTGPALAKVNAVEATGSNLPNRQFSDFQIRK